MDSVPVWVVLVGLGLIGALLTLLWRGSDKRHDVHAEQLTDHEKRLTTLEEEMRTEKAETRLLRESRHEYREEITKTLAGWFIQVTDYVRKQLEDWRR